MDLSPYLQQLREDLSSAASVGDEQTRQTAAVLAAAIEPAARLAIMNALSDLAAEVTTHLDSQVVEVRLDGRDIRVSVTGSGTESQETPHAWRGPTQPPPRSATDGGDISRISLRLIDELKSQAERAASMQGVSLNTWVAQAVQGALHGHPGPGCDTGPKGGRGGGEPSAGSRLRGWVQG